MCTCQLWQALGISNGTIAWCVKCYCEKAEAKAVISSECLSSWVFALNDAISLRKSSLQCRSWGCSYHRCSAKYEDLIDLWWLQTPWSKTPVKVAVLCISTGGNDMGNQSAHLYLMHGGYFINRCEGADDKQRELVIVKYKIFTTNIPRTNLIQYIWTEQWISPQKQSEYV